MSRTREQTRIEPDGNALACPACGAAARRASAHFCATCGRGLRERTYSPGDALLASYHQQHSRPAMLIEQEMSGIGEARATSDWWFDASRNTSRGSALVVVIFAFVPFLGILFCPCAIVMGIGNLRRPPDDDKGTRLAVFNIVCGVLIFGVQAFLWWILYRSTK